MNKEQEVVRPYGIGRRKSAVAQVRLIEKSEVRIINGIKIEEYFPVVGMQKVCLSPLEVTSKSDDYGLEAKVRGGGKQAQVDAVRHGIARALVAADGELRGQLKIAGMLTRDARVKERKKYGLKRARRAPQFSKR